MIRYLKEVSPWLRFIGIVGFVFCGSFALSGLVFLIAFPALSSGWSEISEISEVADFFGTVYGAFMGLYFIGAAVLYFFPSLFQYRFGSKIRSYLQSGSDHELEVAFKNNKSIWKFNGILIIISLAFVPITVVGAIIAVIATGALGG
jgi:hypothetical protein